jgi:hypothetical protein
MFPHCNIHKFTWISPDATTHNQTDHILIDRRQHSGVPDVRSFRAADCDTDHYPVVPKVKERVAVSKQIMHRFHILMERFNLKKLNEAEGTGQHHVEISNRFTALENLYDMVNINTAWETIKQIIKISAKESLGYYELKKRKRWFD